MKDILSAINGTEFDNINATIARIINNMLRLVEQASEEVINKGVTIENVDYDDDGSISSTRTIINPACKFLTDTLRELKINMTSFNIDRRSQLKLFESKEEKVTIAQIMSDLRENGEIMWQ